MKAPEWVEREAVLALHEQLLASFGGSAGVRDQGLLESALARPRDRFAYGAPSLFEVAAGYAFGLVKNHPFVDGNKRTGFTAAALFLELNGYAFGAPEAEVVIRTLALASGDDSEADFAACLERNSRRSVRKRR